MRWTYSIKNKLVASGTLFILCLLVLFSNYLDRDHTSKVKNSISTLYEDRIIVEGYILDMTSNIYQIKELLHRPEQNSAHVDEITSDLLAEIHTIINAYRETEFTEMEVTKFNELLKLLEEFETVRATDSMLKSEIADQAIVELHELSEIQLAESKRIVNLAERLYNSGKVISQFAFGLVIIILLFLQALVFTSKTIIVNNQSPPNLN